MALLDDLLGQNQNTSPSGLLPQYPTLNSDQYSMPLDPNPAPTPVAAQASLPDTSGLLQNPLYQKALDKANTPTGLTHFKPDSGGGFWKGLGKVAEGIGNVGLDIFAPGTAELIPGTQLHRDLEAAQGKNELGQLQKQADDAEKAKAAEDRAKTAQDIAGKGEWKEIPNVFGPNKEPVLYNSLTGDSKFGNVSGVTSGTDKGDKEPLTNVNELQKNINAQATAFGIKDISGFQLPPSPTKGDFDRIQKQMDTFGSSQATAAQREQANSFRQQAMALQSQTASNTQNDRLANYVAKRLDTYNKNSQAGHDQLEKIDETIADIDSGAEGQALGLTKVLTSLVSGAGTGVKVTQGELNAILQARGVQGDAQGFLNKISGQGSFSSTQREQLKRILEDVRNRVFSKLTMLNEVQNDIQNSSDYSSVGKAEEKYRDNLDKYERSAGVPPDPNPGNIKDGYQRHYYPGSGWGQIPVSK